jgi:hypothetical protein
MKHILTIIAIFTSSIILAYAGESAPWRVHYSIRGSGRDITVLAETSSEARRVVMDMFPGAVVTGVHRIRK